MPDARDADFDDRQIGLLLSLVPDAAVVVDEAGSIVAANERVEQLFGHDPGKLIGRSMETLVPERLRQAHRQHRHEFADAPRARTMGAGLDLYGRRKDGSEVPVDISLAPVSTTDGLRVVAAIRDLSDRKAIAATEGQLAAIVRSSLDGIVSTTVEGVVTSWNPGAERLFGYGPDDVVGSHVSVLVPDEYSADLEMLLEAAQGGEALAPRDTAWRTKAGGLVDVALSVSAVSSDAGELLGFSALLRDATQRKRAEREQSATAQIRVALLSSVPTADVLSSICRHARDVLGGDAAMLATIGASGLAAVGSSIGDERTPSDLLEDPVVKSVLDTGETEYAAATRGAGDGTLLLCAPVVSGRVPVGVLVVAGVGHGRPTVDAADIAAAETLADQAALAFELDKARDDRERLVVVEDRERIARDLHDLVIQRLFAIGMMMQAALRLTGDEVVSARVNEAVDDLDATIREIRTVIFELGSPLPAQVGLRSEVLELVGRSTESLGFDPTVHFEGPIDTGVPPTVVPHLLAAIGEGLSNVARHAQATRVLVELSLGEVDVRLVVEDDGVGAAGAKRSSGLSNLRARASSLGGDMEVTTGDRGGTRLVWRVPC